MKIIKARIKGDMFADVFVDDEDFNMLSEFTWKINTSGHVQTIRLGRTILLHRLVMGINDPNIIVDHRDRIKTNCQKYNLRKTDIKGNSRNRTSTGDSGHTGVYKVGNKYRARIKVNGKNISLGNYTSLDEATNARKQGELKYWRTIDNE